MPYHPMGISQLSQAQMKKLLAGGRIRVKAGSAHSIQMVPEHAKKLASAAKKGAGITLQLDPYACDLNRETEGCGVGKKIKAGFKKVGQFVKGNKEAFRPLATSLKQAGRDAIADASMYALDQGIDPALVSAYSQLAQDTIPSGQGVGKKIKAGFKKVGQFVKGNKEAFRPLATSLKQAGRDAIADASMYALDQGIDPALVSAYSQLAQETIPSGGSLKSFSKGLTKFVRSPAVKVVRKALRPLAQQAFNDLQQVAFAGMDMATQQALSGMSAPTGMGAMSRVRRVGRAGGALYPAGY